MNREREVSGVLALAFILIALIVCFRSHVVPSADAQTVNQGAPGTAPWTVTAPCFSPVETMLVFDGGLGTACPSFPLQGRRSVTLCNSKKNTGSPQWTIRADGTAPVTTAGTPGQVLGVGDCATYTLVATFGDAGSTLKCISDTNSSILNITECK